MRTVALLASLGILACGSNRAPGTDGGTSSGAGHFTYTFGDRVYRVEARVGATPEDVSAALARFGAGTRDRWLIPSHDGAWLVVSTDRLACSLGECLAIAPANVSSLALVTPGGAEVAVEGTPAVSNDGQTVVYASSDGPHELDLWQTKKAGSTWGAAVLLTGSSMAAYNNMPALTFDGQRVLFDCGAEPYPESGGNDACEVRLDGSGFRVLVRPSTLPGTRENFVQFPHDSLDGVLFQGSWPIAAETPETIWLLPASGAPTPLGRSFSNAVSPCGLRDGRWGLLWLSRPGNASGAHELSLAARDGALLGTLTPGVDVSDIGIGCSD
ncbi:MAG: hypothetical protein ACOZQL_11970 [Myxococcota bacterium]